MSSQFPRNEAYDERRRDRDIERKKLAEKRKKSDGGRKLNCFKSESCLELFLSKEIKILST